MLAKWQKRGALLTLLLVALVGCTAGPDEPGDPDSAAPITFSDMREAGDLVPSHVLEDLETFAGTSDSEIKSVDLNECADLEIFDRNRPGLTHDFWEGGVVLHDEYGRLEYLYHKETGQFCRTYAPGFIECLEYDKSGGREYSVRIYREIEGDDGGSIPIPCYVAVHRQSQTVVADSALPADEVEVPAELEAPADEAVDEPPAEATAVVDRTVFFRSGITGLTLTASPDFNVLDKGWSSGDAHVLADHMFGPAQVKAYPVDVMSLPGTDPMEALQEVFERDYEEDEEGVTWTVIEPAAELEVNGVPAARLLVERVEEGDDTVRLLQLTLIRGEERASLVEGWLTKRVEGLLQDVTDVANSLELGEPEAFCYVGVKSEGETTQRKVLCDGLQPAVEGLEAGGYEIEMGPTTWAVCADHMREMGASRW